MITQILFTIAIVVSLGLQAFVGFCMIAAMGWFPNIPAGMNWFAVVMVALNIGAAFWGLRTGGGINQLIYGLTAAILNVCVYFNFDKIIGRFQ